MNQTTAAVFQNTRTQTTGFFPLYFKMFYRPTEALEHILSHKQKLLYGFLAFLVPAVGYTLFYIMAWYAGGSPSSFKPWLAIPMEEYFKYGIFLSLPGYFISWVTAAAVVYLISRILNESSNFDDTLTIIGFGIGIASWSSLLHDLTDAFLAIAGIIEMQEYEKLLNQPGFWRSLLMTLYLIYFIWFMILFTKGISISCKMKKIKAMVLAFMGLIVFQLTLLIFIR